MRPALLAGIGLVAAVLVQQLINPEYSAGTPYPRPALPEWKIALATAIGVGGLGFGFVAERVRLGWAVAFALAVGVISGAIRYWSGGGDPGGFPFADWRYASLALALGVAMPLFQTARDEGAWRFPNPAVHAHAWIDAVLWCAGWAFTGIVFALAWLLAELFELIGIKVLTDLLKHRWFAAALLGAALGGGLGLLRERDRVVRLLQRVVTTVLAVLAPVLGAGLVLFLLALPFTGLGALWEATKSTTPILLSCVIGALLLTNAVIGSDAEEELGNPALRFGALALGVAVLPLGAIAAIATGLRIGQHGLTPDRLWAVVFVALATAYGLAYLVAVARRRLGWAGEVRVANLRLAFGVATVALLLATPLVSFNQLSTDAQVARLRSGRVAPERFDWAALAFDFGDPGKRALARLARSADLRIATRAREAGKQTNRWQAAEIDRTTRAQADLPKRLRVLPQPTTVPPELLAKLVDWEACGPAGQQRCVLLYRTGANEAVVLPNCFERSRPNVRVDVDPQDCSVAQYVRSGREWVSAVRSRRSPVSEERRRALAATLDRGEVEVRPVTRRQVFVGGVAVGAPFE